MPTVPSLIRSVGMAVASPVFSVCPYTSRRSMPSAMYQRISSGAIGAAPVAAPRARCRPSERLMLSSATKSATRKASRSPSEGRRPAIRRSAIFAPTPIAQPYATRAGHVASRMRRAIAE